MPAGWRGTLEAAALLFFAYTGYARIATLGEEVRDPERTIPRAVILRSAARSSSTSPSRWSRPERRRSSARRDPGTDLAAARVTGAPGAATVVAIGGVAAMLGVILSQLLGLSRMIFAMARRRTCPPPSNTCTRSTACPTARSS